MAPMREALRHSKVNKMGYLSLEYVTGVAQRRDSNCALLCVAVPLMVNCVLNMHHSGL